LLLINYPRIVLKKTSAATTWGYRHRQPNFEKYFSMPGQNVSAVTSFDDRSGILSCGFSLEYHMIYGHLAFQELFRMQSDPQNTVRLQLEVKLKHYSGSNPVSEACPEMAQIVPSGIFPAGFDNNIVF